MSEFFDDGSLFYEGERHGYLKRKSETQLCDMDEEDDMSDMHGHSHTFLAKTAKRICMGNIKPSLSTSIDHFYVETQENIQPKARNALVTHAQYPQDDGNMCNFSDNTMDTPVSHLLGASCHTVVEDGGSGERTSPSSCDSYMDPQGRPVIAVESSSAANVMRRPAVLSDYYSFQRPMYELMQSPVSAHPRPKTVLHSATAGGHQIALGDAMDMEVEPMQQDSSCPTCSRSFGASDAKLSKMCNFCMKIFCEGTCIAACDMCREEFCKNCSTPNYKMPHGQFVCIDCSNRVK